MSSKLSEGQIFKRVIDEATNRLRVDANITAPSGSAIIIDDIDDSIKIGNGSGIYADVTLARALKVDIGSNASIGVKPPGFANVTAGFPKQITVTATNTQLLAANSLRAYAHFSNNTGFQVYLQFSQSAVVNQGIRLNPGALFTVSGYDLWLGSINAITSSGSVKIDVFEGVY